MLMKDEGEPIWLHLKIRAEWDRTPEKMLQPVLLVGVGKKI